MLSVGVCVWELRDAGISVDDNDDRCCWLLVAGCSCRYGVIWSGGVW